VNSCIRQCALVCTILVALPLAEARAEAERGQNFAARNWFEQLFNFNQPRPAARNYDAPVYQDQPTRRYQKQRRAPTVAQPRREENVDPDGEPTARRAPDIAVYMPAGLVPLEDRSLTVDGITDPVSTEILAQLSGKGGSALQVTPDARTAIIEYYRKRDFIPAWISVQGLNPRARDMLAVFARADDEGLSPADYLPASLTSFVDDGRALTGDPKAAARLDLEVTVALLKYAAHARAGRTDPNKITRFNDLNPPALPAAEVLAAVSAQPRPGSYLESLHPTNPYYQAFRTELHELRARSGNVASLPPIESGPALKVGMRDGRVPALRKRLAALGLLSDRDVAISGASDRPTSNLSSSRDAVIVGTLSDTIEPDVSELGASRSTDTTGSITVASVEPVPGAHLLVDPTLYDADVAAAVKAFQQQAGLQADGVLGRQTLAAFNNENDASKIDRLIMNMERARWLPRDLGDRYIIVNQPAYELRLVDKGVETHRARVVIGTPVNQTPAFSDVMKTIEFNPYWNVPRSIALNEMLPKSRRDPSYLSRNGYEVVNSRGQVVHSTAVDWSRFDGRGLAIRQPPGPANALGEMKFLFPNRHAVYLHDTPSKSLFGRDRRAFSHGCVRVHEPRKLAEIILARDGWTPERIAAAIATKKNNGVSLKHRLDVHLTYFTAWPDENGKIRYYDDVYGRDAKLAIAMQGKRASF